MLALALGRATAMTRPPAALPAGFRLTDHISLGVIARTFPPDLVRQILADTGKASERERDLPAHVMVYYAIALALHTTSGTREVLRRLHERLVRPIATPATRGAWYRTWRLVSLDGSCLDIADTEENCAAFGRPAASRGESAFPQVRFVALVENGTHVLFGARPAFNYPHLGAGGARLA